MKKLRSMYQSYMFHPILYQTVTRCVIALVVILLWDRFVEHPASLSPVRDAGLLVGIVFLAMAWCSYLWLDGVRINRLEKEKKPKPRRRGSDMVDFADEHITTADELTAEERHACTLASNAIAALVFLIPALIGHVLFIL